MGRKREIWQAPEAVGRFLQKPSGNELNGLGEKESRGPSTSFWHEPTNPHLKEIKEYVLDTIYTMEGAEKVSEAFHLNPDFDPSAESGQPGANEYLPRGPAPIDVSPAKAVESPEAFKSQIKEFVLDFSEDIGVTEMQSDWLYPGYNIKEKYVVVIAVAHDYEELSQAPSLIGDTRAVVDVGKQYTRGAIAAAELRNFIRSRGYAAENHEGPDASALLMIPAAIKSGMGELGKHGSLIHRKLGSAFRLAAVTTDMPLIVDTEDTFGADEFCATCQVCSNACPPDAIYPEKQWVRGEKKWYVDFDKCIPYFAEARSCAICIAVCPWSRPSVADNLVMKLARRKQRKQTINK